MADSISALRRQLPTASPCCSRAPTSSISAANPPVPEIIRRSIRPEQDRVLPVIAGILSHHPDAILSIDTYRADTAAASIQAGAEIVNDVSGFQWDPAMPGTCARLGCGVVLMHTRGKPAEWKHQARLRPEEVLPLVRRQLEERLASAVGAGVEQERIVLDPGFGFGKVLDENYPLLANLSSLRDLDAPFWPAFRARPSLATRSRS